jgi:hypothetical protein
MEQGNDQLPYFYCIPAAIVPILDNGRLQLTRNGRPHGCERAASLEAGGSENPGAGDEGDDSDEPVAGLQPSDHVHLACS